MRQYSQQYAARCATNCRSDSVTSLPKLSVLSRPRLCHDHHVLELQVIFKFRLLFGRDVTVLGACNEPRYASLHDLGGAKRHDRFGSRTAAMKSIISSY